MHAVKFYTSIRDVHQIRFCVFNGQIQGRECWLAWRLLKYQYYKMKSTNSLEMHSFLVGRQTSGSNDVWSDTATRSFKVKEYEHVYVFIHITDFVFSNPSIGYFHKFSKAIDKNSFLVLVSFILVYLIVIRLTVFLSVLASSFSSKVMNWLNAFCS